MVFADPGRQSKCTRDAEVDSRTLARKTLSGLQWTIGGTAVGLLAQVGHAAVMARLLEPADFGLVALSFAFLRFGGYLAQLGIGPALIQKPLLETEDVRSAYTVSLLLGLALASVFAMISPLIAAAADAEVVPVMRVLALTILITSLGTTSLSILKRSMRFRALALIELAAYLCGYVLVGITLALLGYGVWSLVFAALSQCMITAIASIVIIRHSLMPHFEWSSVRAIYRYGLQFSSVQLLTVSAHSIFSGWVSNVSGVGGLGLLDRARLLVELPFEKAETSVTKVMFPTMSRLTENLHSFRRAFLLQNSLVASLFFPTLAGMAVSSDLLVKLVLGPQWTEAAELVALLALVTALNLLGHFSRVAFDALDLLKIRIVIELGSLLFLFLAMLKFSIYGLPGMLTALALYQGVRATVYVGILWRRLELRFRDLAKVLLPGLVASCVVAVLLDVVQRLTGLSGINGFLLQVVIGAAVLLGLFRSVLFRLLRADLNGYLWGQWHLGDSSERSESPATRVIRLLFGGSIKPA